MIRWMVLFKRSDRVYLDSQCCYRYHFGSWFSPCWFVEPVFLPVNLVLAAFRLHACFVCLSFFDYRCTIITYCTYHSLRLISLDCLILWCFSEHEVKQCYIPSISLISHHHEISHYDSSVFPWHPSYQQHFAYVSVGFRNLSEWANGLSLSEGAPDGRHGARTCERTVNFDPRRVGKTQLSYVELLKIPGGPGIIIDFD